MNFSERIKDIQQCENLASLVNVEEVQEIGGKHYEEDESIKELFQSIMQECNDNISIIEKEIGSFDPKTSIKIMRSALHQLKGLSFIDKVRTSAAALHECIHEFEDECMCFYIIFQSFISCNPYKSHSNQRRRPPTCHRPLYGSGEMSLC
ncbi:hypothetical protein WA158_000646 [Blastocystis sp. Blastoise]